MTRKLYFLQFIHSKLPYYRLLTAGKINIGSKGDKGIAAIIGYLCGKPINIFIRLIFPATLLYWRIVCYNRIKMTR